MDVLSLDKKEKWFSNEGRKGFAFKKQGMFCVILAKKIGISIVNLNNSKPNWFSNHELKQLQAKLIFKLWT